MFNTNHNEMTKQYITKQYISRSVAATEITGSTVELNPTSPIDE